MDKLGWQNKSVEYNLLKHVDTVNVQVKSRKNLSTFPKLQTNCQFWSPKWNWKFVKLSIFYTYTKQCFFWYMNDVNAKISVIIDNSIYFWICICFCILPLCKMKQLNYNRWINMSYIADCLYFAFTINDVYYDIVN